MRLKDYYRVLGVSSSATAEEIRKAFRRLALQYHPDRNPDSPFAAGHFIEIKEAYHILSDDYRRARYDEECWLLGMSNRTPLRGQLSAAWIKGEAVKLRRHMERIDSYRMNHEALQQYTLLLLSDAHLSVMENSTLLPEMVNDVLAAITGLRTERLPPVIDRLMILAGNDASLKDAIQALLKERKEKEQREKSFGIFIAFFVLLMIIIALLVVTK